MRNKQRMFSIQGENEKEGYLKMVAFKQMELNGEEKHTMYRRNL